MNSKQLQNIIYTAAKTNLVTYNSITFATNFDSVVNKAISQQNDKIQMYRTLCNYFISLGLDDLVRNQLADLYFDKELDENLTNTISKLSKIEALTDSQCFLIDYIKKQLVKLSKIKELDFIDDSDSTQDINSNDFIQSFNNILDQKDIASILNFIQVNGLQQLYLNKVYEEKEPILIFKEVYDEINSKENQELVRIQALSRALQRLANSADDEQLKQNCQFLSDEKIEFPVKENSTIVLSKFKEYELELNLNGKTINNVETLLTNIIKDDNFIIDLKQDESNEIKKQLLNAIKEATKNLNAELGFPETIQGDNYSAEQLLNMVLNKRVDKKYIDLIEIIFKEDSIDMFKNTNIYDTETLYEGLYYDFKDVFDNDIKPSIDTGYKMVDDINTFWNAANKLQKTLTNDNIKECFKEFGTVAFHCNDYMIAVKMLFTIFNNVSEDRVYMCLLYVTMVMTDNIIGNVWNNIKKLF